MAMTLGTKEREKVVSHAHQTNIKILRERKKERFSSQYFGRIQAEERQVKTEPTFSHEGAPPTPKFS